MRGFAAPETGRAPPETGRVIAPRPGATARRRAACGRRRPKPPTPWGGRPYGDAARAHEQARRGRVGGGIRHVRDPVRQLAYAEYGFAAVAAGLPATGATRGGAGRIRALAAGPPPAPRPSTSTRATGHGDGAALTG
ncbi:hypothetical protein NKH77_00890 [Streptomyces sp. M19]